MGEFEGFGQRLKRTFWFVDAAQKLLSLMRVPKP